MNRRNFIGSTIGLFVGSQLPYVSEAAKPIVLNRKLEKAKRYLRIFDLDKEKLYRFALVIQDVFGDQFYAPYIKNVTVDQENVKARFEAAPVDVTQTFRTQKIMLLDDSGFQITSQEWCMNACVGDKLVLTYTAEVCY